MKPFAHSLSWGLSSKTAAAPRHSLPCSAYPQATCLRSGQDVVLKAYALSGLSDFLRNQVLRELHIHSRLCNTGVVQLLGAFRVSEWAC